MSHREKKEISTIDFWGISAAIRRANYAHVKAAVSLLPKTTPSESKTKSYEIRCTQLRLALRYALEMYSSYTGKSDDLWRIVLFINHTLCRDFPISVKYHIENFVAPSEHYSILAYDNVPQQLSSQAKYCPFNSLWQSIFVVHKDLLETCSKVSGDFLYLTQAFRAMGWGREIPLEVTPFEKHLKKSLSQAGLAISLVPQAKIKGVLSQLIQSLKLGAKQYENMIKKHDDIVVAIIEQTGAPKEISKLVCGYMGFFTPEKNNQEKHSPPTGPSCSIL